MVITFSDNYRTSIPAATATITWASTIVATGHAISQPAASIKIYWSHKVMSLSIILKYWTVIYLRSL